MRQCEFRSRCNLAFLSTMSDHLINVASGCGRSLILGKVSEIAVARVKAPSDPATAMSAGGLNFSRVKRNVEIIAQNKGLLPTPDQLGHYGYNPNLSAYVEIISYTKLLRDAKKRNCVLFDKLHLPAN